MSEVNRLSNRNKAIQEMLSSGEQIKNFYRFAVQNPHIDLHDACQIVIDRPNASVCFSFDEWNAMGRRVSKGKKGIAYFDRDGNKQFVFDANDTHGETRFKRHILPMKCVLEGLDELNGTELADSSRRDYQKILSGVAIYLQQNEGFTDDEQKNRLLAEGVAYSLYSCTSFPKDNGIHLVGYPYSLTENAQLFCQIRDNTVSLREEIEDAYLRKQQQVPIIDDTEEEVITDEPVIHEDKNIIEINSASISQYKYYDVLCNGNIGEENVYIGRRENYDNSGHYDNSDNSLILVSHNTKMFELLQGNSYVISQKAMYDNEMFSEQDYKEYSEICTRLDEQLDRDKITRFSVEKDKENSGYPFRYPDYKGNPTYMRYMSAQDEYPDATVVMRLGDFYEVLGERAKETAEILDLTLTGRDCGLDERVPMCGFPYHVTQEYFGKILEQRGIVILEPDKEPMYILSRKEAKEFGEENYKDSQGVDEEQEEIDEDEEEQDEQHGVSFEDDEEYIDIDELKEIVEKPTKEKKPEKGIKERKRKEKPQLSLFDLMDKEEDADDKDKEELIKVSLRHGSGVEDGKYRIYDKYQQNPTKTEFAEFLKDEYGTGGWSSMDSDNQMHDAKGIVISSADKSIVVNLKWNEVAERIANLIDDEEYFTSEERREVKRIIRFREERAEAKDDQELIRIIARQIVEYGTQKSYNGKFNSHPHCLDDCGRFIDTHIKEINACLKEHDEVFRVGEDNASYYWGLNTQFYYDNSPGWQARTERLRERSDRIQKDADDFILGCSGMYTEDNEDLEKNEILWEIFPEDYGEEKYLFFKDNRDELLGYLNSVEGVKSATLSMHSIDIVFEREYIQALRAGITTQPTPIRERAQSIVDDVIQKGRTSTINGNSVVNFDEIKEHREFIEDNLPLVKFLFENSEAVNHVEINDKGIDVDLNLRFCQNYINKAVEQVDNLPRSLDDEEDEDWEELIESGVLKPIERTEEKTNTNLDEIGFDQNEFGGAKKRYKNNVEAIKLVDTLFKEDRNPTDSEKKVLAKYVGWGGIPQVFDENNAKWQAEYKELKNLLLQNEYETAKGSVLNAHFTAKEVIGGIYKALHKMGVRGNNKILEPALGTGNFFGFMPQEISENAKLYGVELDEITGKIATKLYPQANIQIKGFEQTTFPDNQFDLMISNVPFGNYSVYDSEYSRQNFQIHDYFIAKGIDKIKPNGLMAVITSKGTLDKLTPTVRKYIADRAELVGAIRLPNNAFKQTAETEVTSDILFFRKREEKIDATTENTEWLSIGKDEQGFELNNYYIKHPEMVCGTLAEEHGLYGLLDLTVKPDGRSLEQAIDDAIQHLPENIYVNPEYKVGEEESKIEVDYNVRPLCYQAKNGKLYMRVGDEMVEQTIPNTPKDAYTRITEMINLRENVRHILEIQLDGCSDTALETEQWELGKRYDSFVKKYGYLNSQTNSKLFRDDADSALLFAVENIAEDKKSATKADIFTKRTIRPYTVITQTDDCFEALQISRNEKGVVDIAFIEELTKKDYDTVLSELGDTVYRNPMQVNPEDKYSGFQTQDEYLSGEVVKKLQQARHFVSTGHTEYERNVTALEQVQPVPLKATDISVKLGASWIDKDMYKQCLCEMLKLPYWVSDGIELYYNRHDGSWRVDRSDYAKGHRPLELTQVYGTERANAYRLFEDCMNQKSTQIYDTIEDSDGREKRVLNQAETIAAREKQNKIQEFFKNWVCADPDRRELLENKYNAIFNQIRLPSYDGSHLKFPEMNPAIELRPHQKNAVHRITSTGNNTLLHHVVGSGKTITMITSGMKLKQYGLAKKPMYVVPNHLVQQWADEFRKTYPNAKILITQKDDLDKDKRKRFVSKVAMGDWDGIIIAQSTFAKIAISPERQIRKIREEINSIEESITSQWMESNTPRGAVKNLERIKKSREAQLKKLMDDTKKDNVLIFENLGVDYLFVDEADAYKNLFLYTKMNNVAGISNAASQRASDLQMKIEYINELHGGDKGVVFATGTPISNSMAEMYTLQTYLQKRTLQELGINYFDGWAADFGETVTSLELAPSGQGYRAKTRFAKFTNLPELLTLYRSFADVQTSDMVKLDVPEADRKVVTIKPSDEVIELTEEIADRAERIYGGGVDPHIDNMLKVTSDGKKIALDPRCYDPSMPDSELSKLNECANQIVEYYHESEDIKGTQLVFCDLSTPKKAFADYEYSKDFDAYNDLKHKLVERGIPEEEIAFIHDANSDLQKQALFNKVNEGTIRILIGSTEKCGAGTNVQKRLYALHHLDAPYRPRDLIQRDGRGIRQGNMNKTVHINTYVRERTFDSYSYQILENKQRFISQIDRGDLTVREAEDIDEATLSYAEIKAITSANPKIKRKMELENELQQLRILEGRYKKNLYDLQDKIRKTLPEQIKRQNLYLERLRADVVTAKEQLNPDNFSINVCGKIYSDRKEGGRALYDALQVAKVDQPIAEYCGFKISLDPLVLLTAERTMTIASAGQYQEYISQTGYGTLNRIDALIQDLPDKEQRAVNKLEQLESDLKAAQVEVEIPFEHTDKIAELAKELVEINAELDLNKRDEIVIDDGENSDGEAYMGVPEQEENEITVKQKPRTRLSKAIENLYQSEQEKSPDSFIFIYDKNSYCVIGDNAERIAEMAGVEIRTGLINGKDSKWVSLNEEEFSGITNALMEEKTTVKIVMPDKKQTEETFIDKADLLEQMQVDILPDYNATQDDMHIYGYQWNGMLPMGKYNAKKYFEMGLPIYFLNRNDTESSMQSIEQIEAELGYFGIEKDVWQTFITHKDTYPYIVARKEVCNSFIKTLNGDMDYMDGKYIDRLTDLNIEESGALNRYVNKNGMGDIEKAKQFIPKLIEEINDRLSIVPLKEYGWDVINAKSSIADNIHNQELSQTAKDYVEELRVKDYVDIWLDDIEWLNGRQEGFSVEEVNKIIPELKGNTQHSFFSVGVKEDAYDEWYEQFTNNRLRPELEKRYARFEYGNKTFIPYRVFTEEEKAEDMPEFSKRLAHDHDLGIADISLFYSTYPYSHADFYEAAKNNTCDLFLCEENGKVYAPGENELFMYLGEKGMYEDRTITEDLDKILDEMSAEEVDELLNVQPVNYKEEVIKSVEEELQEFRGALTAMDTNEIADMHYQIHLKHNVADMITNIPLPDKVYEKLYEHKGEILEVISNNFAENDTFNEQSDQNFMEAILDVAEFDENELEITPTQTVIVPDIKEEYEIKEKSDYSKAVIDSVEKEFDRFREDMISQPQINVFYSCYKILSFGEHKEVIQTGDYLSDDEYQILYEERGQILENLYNDGLDNETADLDSYADVARHISNYCKMRQAEKEEFEQPIEYVFANVACKEDIEKAIEINFDGMHLNKDFEDQLIEKYGIERMRYVLANTVQQKQDDGRFSSETKAWANSIEVNSPDEDKVQFIVESHPAVLDGFINRIRKKEPFDYAKAVKEETQQEFKAFSRVAFFAPDINEFSGQFRILVHSNYNEFLQKDNDLTEDEYKTLYADKGHILENLYNDCVKKGILEVENTDISHHIKYYCQEQNKKIEQMEVKEEMPEKQGKNKKNWLKANVPFEAVIQTRANHSFMRMPNNGEYAGYTYNLFNNRIRNGTRITDIQSDSRERCLVLNIAEDQEILIRNDDNEITLTGKQFVDAVHETYAKDYEQERDESAWTNINVPSDAMRGMYDNSSLFSMPTDGEYNGYSYYVPNVFINEDKNTDEGRINITLPNDFEVNIRNRETQEQIKMTPAELHTLANGTQKENYALKREQENAMATATPETKDSGWHYASVSEEAMLGKYDNASLFKMPNGKYENYLYYLPNNFLKENAEKHTVRVGLPDDFKVTIKDKANDDEITLTASEYMAEIRGKEKEDYTQKDDKVRFTPKEGKFNEEAEKRLRDSVPEEMKSKPNWIAIRTRYNQEKGKINKYLINPITGEYAESDNPETWTNFDDACKFARENGCDALAYALDGNDGIACIDLDNCKDENGNYTETAKEALSKCGKTYIETSVSGKGLHIFGTTQGMDVRTYSKDGDMEFYRKSHFITMTGDGAGFSNLESFDKPDMKAFIEKKYEKRTEFQGAGIGVEGLSSMSDRDVMDKAMKGANGDTFSKLYRGDNIFNDHSRSDMSLMSRLAFWCNGDKDQMLRIFATSGLYRPNKSPDYYECTAIKALKGNTGRISQNQSQPKPIVKPTGNSSGGKR